MPLKRAAGNSSAAPKRARFETASHSDSHSNAGPSRSPPGGNRTDTADGDDQFLDADITESSRGAKKREKRVLKDTDGYGSDSSNDDGEGVVPSRRADAAKDDDDDVDMFAEDEPADDDKGKGKAKDKKNEFMNIDEIEGQEFTRRPSADDDDSDSEVDEAAKNKGTGLDGDMGVELTPFNMKTEMEEGRFTEGGEQYVENDKDEHDKHDGWLDAVDKDAIKKARRAHRERERLEQEREAREAETSGLGSEDREHGLMRSATELMERGETVLEALQRLGKEAEDKAKKESAGSKKKSWAERQKERKAQLAADSTYVYHKGITTMADRYNSDPAHANPFTKLSEIVSQLTAIGQLDVYSLSREAIQRMLPRQPEPERPSAPALPQDTRQFQYRFSMAYMRTLPEAQRPVERDVFGEFPDTMAELTRAGPFSSLQLVGWKSTGFFGPNCENVELRNVTGGQEGQWGSWTEVVG